MSHLPVQRRDDELEDNDEDSVPPPPPDGGWGWAVVFGSFMIHIVTDGVTYSFGVFYDEFLDYFKEGKGATAWILSILVGVTLCSGPISSSLVNRWDCRVVTIAGAILGSLSLMVSVWAQNVTTLYFTIGVGAGFGFGLIYLPAIVSVTTYFEKKRSLATGIAVCGSGFGTFIFAPIITKLLEVYGWRGAMLIISGIVLECIIFGALFRPLEYSSKTSGRSVQSDTENEITEKYLEAHALSDYHTSDQNLNQFSSLSIGATRSSSMHRPASLANFTTNEGSKLALSKDKLQNRSTARFAFSQPLLMTKPELDGRYTSHGHLRGPIYKADVFYQGSLMNIPPYRSRLSLRYSGDNEMLRRGSLRSRTHSINYDEDEKEQVCCGKMCSKEVKDTLNEMLDFSLFKDPIFIVFTLSNFLTSIGFNIPYVYIVSRAKSLGISDGDASLLLAIIGIANTVGRIILGYISDNPKVNRLWVYNFCLTICGLATAFSTLCLDFYTLCIYAIVFGFTIGAYVGLTSVILVDLLGMENLTNAFGLLLLFQGVASLIGPPIAGELYDSFQSYSPGFILSGISITISGVILFAIPAIKRWKDSKLKPKTHI